jgi:hypothetical protein
VLERNEQYVHDRVGSTRRQRGFLPATGCRSVRRRRREGRFSAASESRI